MKLESGMLLSHGISKISVQLQAALVESLGHRNKIILKISEFWNRKKKN